jgi:hypothetical protein
MSILTRLTGYRPNFCSECGNKIVRLRWFVWTSRRLCDKCARSFARTHWLRPAITILVFFLAAFFMGRGCRRAPPPLIIERPVSSSTASAAAGANSSSNSGANSNATAASNSTTAQPTPTPDDLYTCGARTKKGTPCSRRVHGPTRCWQHKGSPAMLPQERLRIKE